MVPEKPPKPDGLGCLDFPQRPDLFFTDSMAARHRADSLSPTSSSSSMPMSSQLYPYHQQAFASTFTPPPISTPANLYSHNVQQLYHHRFMVSPPPLPPKPVVYPTINSNTGCDDYLEGDCSLPTPLPPLPPLPPPPLPPPPLSSPPLSPPPLQPPPQDEVNVTLPTEDSDELAMVLALSQSESVQKKLLEEQLTNQEEEDLARALAASMLPSENNFPTPSNSTNVTPESKSIPDTPRTQSSHMPLALPPNDLPGKDFPGPSIPHDAYAEFERYDKWHIPNHLGKQQGEEEAPKIETQPNVARGESPSTSSVSLLPYDPPSSPKLAGKRSSISSVSSLPYRMPERRSSELPEYSHINGDSQEISVSGHSTVGDADLYDLVTPGTVLEFDDAAYARQLAAEEEEFLKQSLHSEGIQDYFVDRARSSSTSYGKQNAERTSPQSGRTMPHGELYGRQYPSPTVPSSLVPGNHSPPVLDYTFPPIARANSYQHDTQSKSLEHQNSPVQLASAVHASLGIRRGSAPDIHSEMSPSSSSPPLHADRSQLRSDTMRPAARRPSQTLPSQAIATTSTSATDLNQQVVPFGVPNVNHFVDLELLRGVSIGFKSPLISTQLVQMQDQMPNIISLPYTRCPPLHIQAPNWRHLLRLMARLSCTRMEPTVQAMTVSKVELKLRTVIQFVKPHPSSGDWRSVLWFTIDQPVPSSVPGAMRYTSGNPNLLPWSYTLSPIPVLLGDACDTNMSKTYTVPATDSIPLPTLPITFPNLALYLQAALDISRRHLGDSPNGLGKLAKMVQICYPSASEGSSEYDIPRTTSVSHLFKRVIGRSNKDKKKGKGTNNEDTYQLVTPFVPDEWG